MRAALSPTLNAAVVPVGMRSPAIPHIGYVFWNTMLFEAD
jgi:hypothetical protein